VTTAGTGVFEDVRSTNETDGSWTCSVNVTARTTATETPLALTAGEWLLTLGGSVSAWA
jgi:hypothetical protein